MKISYEITVKDELNELQRLIQFLIGNKRPDDEIVILYDSFGGSKGVEEWLRANSVSNNQYSWHSRRFDNHFADHKNYLNSLCSGDYIFQIDADELPHENLISQLPLILENNPSVQLYSIPRVNTVEGLTPQHIQKWGWSVNEQGWVNWPDYQMRVYKNEPSVMWANKVHEVIVGHKQYSYVPMQGEWALYHPKTIERQEKQNNYYETL